ncbi:VanW family protein [Amycolatopsis taiwanensis]|uniref:Vanomycin resistance protein VanB n=1 Tax=Amycolatopsis taiwanensis TaxID=342230 RepID=A0A9W6VDK7_9PSEU|nr:VanW family protein [Amycolatopsis taiwanensis]GLY67433.1 vanomycin resistance protein VanB [Amycolatopsis taiwanensis]
MPDPDNPHWPNSDPEDFRETGQLPLPGAPIDEWSALDHGLADEILSGDGDKHRRRTRAKRFVGWTLAVAGGVLALGAVFYAIDLMTSAGDVPRGTVVAGVDVGGLSRHDAEVKLRRELEPRLDQPVPIVAGDVQATLDPVTAGLGVDWPATLAHAGSQSLDPIARIESFFVKRPVAVVTTTDEQALDQAVSQLAQQHVNHPQTEGSIGFRPVPNSDGGVTAFPIEPRQGQTLYDLPGAADLVKGHWLDPHGVSLPVAFTPVLATTDGVHATLNGFVVPAISKPVAVHGDGADARLKPDAIAAAMRFTARPDGSLAATLDSPTLRGSLSPQLATTEQPGKDARMIFGAGPPTVTSSEDAHQIDWDGTFAPLTAVLIKPDGRDLTVRYRTTPPGVTTADAGRLGIGEIIAQFSTSGLSGAAATNVRAMAERVNGVILRPGQTFSLIDRTGPWQGFVPAPLNEDGTGPQVVGGGVSQFATTLYNAAYLAGLTDAGHTDHAYYLDRYPPGRDAEALREDGSRIDLRFTDSLASGVAIQAFGDQQSVTVRIWGTHQYRVNSETSPWRDIVAPTFVQQPGPGCQPNPGAPGFSVTDTRIRYDVATGAEVGRDTRVVRYQPVPGTVCI